MTQNTKNTASNEDLSQGGEKESDEEPCQDEYPSQGGETESDEDPCQGKASGTRTIENAGNSFQSTVVSNSFNWIF